MAITWDDIVAIDASLATVPVATQAAILLDVKSILPLAAWDVRHDQAQKYLAAHMGILYTRATMGSGSGPAGPLTSASVDGVSKSWASPPSGGSTFDPWLALTSWGQMYSMLLMMNLNRLPFVV